VRGEEELRAGAVTYLCVLANEDVGEKLAGAVGDEGGEQLDPDGDARLACRGRGSSTTTCRQARGCSRSATARLPMPTPSGSSSSSRPARGTPGTRAAALQS
jgi:hypothetical protein